MKTERTPLKSVREYFTGKGYSTSTERTSKGTVLKVFQQSNPENGCAVLVTQDALRSGYGDVWGLAKEQLEKRLGNKFQKEIVAV